MKLQKSVSKNATSYYIARSVYLGPGQCTSRIVEKLGTIDDIRKRAGDKDPIEWAKEYARTLTQKEKRQGREIMVKYSPKKQIASNEQRTFNGGYLFLQKIYHELGLDRICSTINSRHSFEYDLNSILSRLIYGRILFPSSKRNTCVESRQFFEQANFGLHQVYRALSVLAKESDYIQSELYKNSLAMFKRNSGVLYYDCTNFFFEIEESDELRKYGYSKEHRPNPIVEMGLFLDGDGMPLAFNINPGNTNEQTTMTPTEKMIVKDFGLSKFVVCTDAGLSSLSNRKFNSSGGRAFVTTQSIKKLKGHLVTWALSSSGWSMAGRDGEYDMAVADEPQFADCTFVKERWINEDGFEQRLIVTYSRKYRDYQRNIRSAQLERANKLIGNPSKMKKHRNGDPRRFISQTNVTPDGEVAGEIILELNNNAVEKEAMYDGYYGVCTNLEDPAERIVEINHQRWMIEDCFRLLKSDFKARPANLSREDRLRAHFATCFMALSLFRILEKKLGHVHSAHAIIKTLTNMNFLDVKGEGFIPEYERTSITDSLHDSFGFRTDYEILTQKNLKKIIRQTKS